MCPRAVTVWDVESGRLILRREWDYRTARSVCFDKDSRRLAWACEAQVVILELATRDVLATLDGHTADVTQVAWNEKGDRLLSTSFDGTVKIWDWKSAQEVLTLEQPGGGVWGGAWSPDDQAIVIGTIGGAVRVLTATKTAGE